MAGRGASRSPFYLPPAIEPASKSQTMALFVSVPLTLEVDKAIKPGTTFASTGDINRYITWINRFKVAVEFI
jgi:hypothetical protein